MAQQVLIVDDSGSIRQSMKYIVEEAGYSVIEAPKGFCGRRERGAEARRAVSERGERDQRSFKLQRRHR